MRKTIAGLTGVAIVAVLAVAFFVYSGIYSVAADDPHANTTESVLETVRERSIATRAAEIQVPPLDSTELVERGAEHYKAMCSKCHLAPGMADTELRQGLYPTPPNLSEQETADPARAFWVIKHGVKLTAMPAWGKTHDDESIWGLVAFIKLLPDLSAEEYEAITSRAGGSHDHGEHGHGDSSSSSAAIGDDRYSHEPSTSATSGGFRSAHSHTAPDSAEGTLDAFHHALEEGRGDEALRYLADDVIILEGGHAQTFEEYAGGHLASDMAFLADTQSTRLSREARRNDSADQVIVATQSRLQGTYGDKQADIVSSETAVLEKREGQWKIVHLHWSS